YDIRPSLAPQIGAARRAREHRERGTSSRNCCPGRVPAEKGITSPEGFRGRLCSSLEGDGKARNRSAPQRQRERARGPGQTVAADCSQETPETSFGAGAARSNQGSAALALSRGNTGKIGKIAVIHFALDKAGRRPGAACLSPPP